MDSLVLDMSDSLLCATVLYHSVPLTDVHHESNLLWFRFVNPIQPGILDSVTVYYSGTPPADDWGTFEIEQHNGVPAMYTMSEPYGASNWWPCKNDLTDKADSLQVIITCPGAYTATTNGLPEKTVSSGGSMTFYYRHRYPISTYLVCLAVTNYAVYTQKVPFMSDTLDMINYVYPEDSADAVPRTFNAVRMIQVFDSLFGVYPFQLEKYGHTQFGWGGGMEHQTNTFVANFEFELLAHELAHQWFGDMVTCGSWTDIWLNEGFATYLSGICYEHIMPELFPRFREVRIKKITSEPGGTVYCSDTTSIDRIFDTRLTYAKGGMILHQLRRIMGDAAFFNALNAYLNDPMLSYGFARTSDLREHLEAFYGGDLGWYFDQWYTGEGYPSYRLNWSVSGNTVQFTLAQTTSTGTITFFRLPVPVRFSNAAHDTIVVFDNLWNGQAFSVTLPFTPDSLSIDPEWELITRNNTVNGVGEKDLAAVISVAPNPASDRVFFRFGEGVAGDGAVLRICGSDGRQLCSEITGTGTGLLSVNTSAYPEGMYFWVLEGPLYRASGKFIIRRH
jgi:aminopeptidase N